MTSTTPQPNDLPHEIGVHSVAEMLNGSEDVLLIDVRGMDEYETASIDGAKLIPMNEIPGRLEELEAYRNRPIVIHCHLGGRSLRVAEFLREQGFPQAQSMAGGIEAWSQQIDESVPRY